MNPGSTVSSAALPIVPAKFVFSSPCKGTFHVMMYSFTPTSLHVSIMYPRAIPPSALITHAKRFSKSAIKRSLALFTNWNKLRRGALQRRATTIHELLNFSRHDHTIVVASEIRHYADRFKRVLREHE